MFTLEQITTSDGVIHQGILAEPSNPNGKALVWVHGLTSTFYNNVFMTNELARRALESGMAFAAFNNRGHDMITDVKKADPAKTRGYGYAMAGSGYENFSDCVFDIDAVLSFLKEKGYREIYVIGHSSGAQKVCYYAGSHDRPELAGIVLASPISDRLGTGGEERISIIESMRKKIAEGKGDELISGLSYFPMTPKRYVSLYYQGSLEDHFDYGDPHPRMKYFSTIQKPLLVLLAGNDENADRPIEEIKIIFDLSQKSSDYQSLIVPDALHGFGGKEEGLAQLIVRFLH